MEESRQSDSDTNVQDDASPHETPRPGEVRLDEAPPRPPDSTIDSAVLFLPRRQPRVRGESVSYEEYPEDLSRPGLRSTFDFSSDKRLAEYLSNEFDAGAEHGMRSIVYVRGRHKSCPLKHDVSLTVDEIVACIRLWLDGRSSS